MSQRNGQAISWTSYQRPNLIAGGSGYTSQFFYTPERRRWKQQASYGGTSEQTIYIGGLIEKVTRGGVTYWRHAIAGGTGTAAIYLRESSGASATYYLTRDHLGSVDAVTDATGQVEVRLAFGAHGQRRNEATWSGNPTAGDWAGITATTRRGYTGHEHLDNLALIHMNGRVYDPVLGRFISADPFIDGAGDTQGWNRYSYVKNNPLNAFDPSGYYESNDRNECHDLCGFGWLLVRGWISYGFGIASTFNPTCSSGPNPVCAPNEPLPVAKPGPLPPVPLPPVDSGSGNNRDRALQSQISVCHMLSVESGEVSAALPEKGFWQQVSDGINSWFDGAGWYLTMLMAKSGALGPEIGAQSRDIERTMAAGVLVINSNREQARAAALAVFQEYPWQSGARFGTGAFMGRGGTIGTGSGVLLGTAVAQGSMAHHAFRAGIAGISPESMILAAVAGEVCR